MNGALQLLHPGWLWWLVPLLGHALWRRRRGAPGAGLASGRPRAGARVIHPLVRLIPRAPQGRGGPLLETLVLALLVVSLGGPVRVGRRLPDPPPERDITFIVDASVSMIQRDYLLEGRRVDRMSLLKGLLGRLLGRFQGERLSLVVFGSHAYTLVPLTRDQRLLQTQLERLRPTVAGRFNAVGEAIALAVRQATAPEAAGRRRVLVLLTAADTPTGEIAPAPAVALAVEAGLPLYTIAIGAESAAAGERRPGGLIYHPAALGRLRAWAERTGALAFRAGDGAALTRAVEAIGRREANRRRLPPRYHQEPLYLWPLLAGLGLLGLHQLRNLFGRRP